MPIRKALLPREGLTADPLISLVKKTILSPVWTVPALLLAYYTAPGRDLVQNHTTAFARLKVLAALGVVRWVHGLLDWGAQNNWKSDKYDWAKEIVVVTGGAGGIGSKVVQLFAERGIKTVVLDVSPMTFAAGDSVHYFKCDITNPEAIKAVATEIRAKIGEPTVLINNAGVARGKSILDSTEADNRFTFDVNTLAHHFLAREFLPHMIKNNHGMVITVASIAAYLSAPRLVDYCASKAAALAFHEGLALELKWLYNAPQVRTVAICQGYTKTPLFIGYANKSTFLFPTLEPDTVAEEIVLKALSGTSGLINLPRSFSMITGLRGWADWLQIGLRHSTKDLMTNWNGKQVMDPEAKYSKKD